MSIPKIVHAAWKTKDVINSDSLFYKNCLGNIAKLSPNWDIQISDDQDVEDYLRDNLDSRDYNLLLNRHIVEKIDVWRLIKLYKEGGLYIDMDRLCNISLDNIINDNTKLVLPTCGDHDFSHDFMMSAPGNPIFYETLVLNLQRRYEGIDNIYFLGPQTYLHGIIKAMFGYDMKIESGSKLFGEIRNMLNETDFIKTYKEAGPLHTVIYRSDLKQIEFDYESEKKKFYSQNNVKHWTVI